MKLFCWLALLISVCIAAQEQSVTMADVSRGRETLANTKNLSEADRNEISALYDQAATHVQQELRWRAQQAGHARSKEVIEKELKAALAAVAVPLPPPPPAPESETAQQAKDESTRVRNDRASRIKTRDELLKLRTALILRGQEITSRRGEIGELLLSIRDERAVLQLVSASTLWERASRTGLQARQQSLEQELLSLGSEREALDVRQQLIPLRREAQLLRLEADEALLEELEVREANARRKDAKKSLESTVAEAKALAAGFPQLSGMAGEIDRRATALWGQDGVAAKSDKIAVQTEQMGASIARFKEITANTRRRYENSGVFTPASEWWPPKVEKFGTATEVGSLVARFSRTWALERRNLFRLEEARDGARAFEAELQEIVAGSGKGPGDADFAKFKSRARSMLQLKRSITTEFLEDGREYVRRLEAAHTLASELLIAIEELQTFVLEHALWARTVEDGLPSPTAYADAFLWFFSYRSWFQILGGLDLTEPRILLSTAVLLAIFALYFYRSRLRNKIAGWCRSVIANLGGIRAQFLGILLELLWVMPLPLLVGYAGWMVGQVGEGVDLGRAIAAGTARLASFLYLALLVRRLFADGGAVGRLLGWSREVRQSLDWGVGRMTLAAAPFYFIAAALVDEGMFLSGGALVQSQHYSLGRLCFNAGVIGMLLIGRRVLRPDGPVAAALASRASLQGSDRARQVRLGWNLACCVALVLSIAGFYMTAFMLIQNLMRIGVLTLFLALISALFRMWRFERQKKISPSHPAMDAEETRKADLQVRKLSRFVLTLIWIAGVLIISSAALPALLFVRKVELLPEFRMVVDRSALPAAQPAKKAETQEDLPAAQPAKKAETQENLPAAQPAKKAETQENLPAAPSVAPVPAPAKPEQAARPRYQLFLSDLLLSIFVAILIRMLVGNIPGLLQFTLFQRLNLDQGGEYAVNTIARYFVILIGVLTVSGIIGVDWSSIQWLAAALTFGIGFGLQEIFANFASGLILLLDRSVRVGDVVTVGTESGTVTRIHMRATTVTLWDRSDMVVPNKELITGKLINWTLSNPETRVDLKVGVAYDSDLKQVREVLAQLAHEHPAVLKSPPPQVLLKEFGDSAIVFELRVFALYSYGPPTLLDELHQALVREFRRLGIEIAFPHLDVNVKRDLDAAPDADPGNNTA